MKFKHLYENDQTYFEHFKDSIHYSFESLKCSFYFFIHGIWPDTLKKDGSEKINKLHEEIKEKYKNIKNNKNSNTKSKKIILTL